MSGSLTMRYIRIFLAATLLGFPGAHSSAEEAAGDAVSDGNEIVALEAKWSALYGARDLDGIMALMARNSVLIMPGSAPVVGAEGIRQATSAMWESGDAVSWRSDFVSVAPGGDMAYDYGTASTKSADGSIVEGRYLVVWIKEDGAWKVAADMFN